METQPKPKDSDKTPIFQSSIIPISDPNSERAFRDSYRPSTAPKPEEDNKSLLTDNTTDTNNDGELE